MRVEVTHKGITYQFRTDAAGTEVFMDLKPRVGENRIVRGDGYADKRKLRSFIHRYLAVSPSAPITQYIYI